MGEKTEQPTAKRMSESRDKGQVPKSQDLNAAVGLLLAIILLLILGNSTLEGLFYLMRISLEDVGIGQEADPSTLLPSFGRAMWVAMMLVAPFMGLFFLGTYLIQFAQVGWLFTMYPLKPKLEKLNPLKGVKKLFNKKNMVKSLVNTLKLAVSVLVVWVVLKVRMETLSVLPMMEFQAAMLVVAKLMLELALALVLLLLILAIFDLIFQRWQHTEELKMTKQEVKDERRSMEGDPLIKRRRFQIAQEMAMQRVGHAVPEADVIITNPTHFSVALKYDPDTMPAPKLTAKGADYIAFRIRHLAKLHGVPIVERAPLARAIYWGVEPGQEIAPEHFEAVAEILAFVYRLDRDKADRIRSREPAGVAS